MRVTLSAPNTLSYPCGGHIWVFINWALGFKSLGHDVYWLDVVPAGETEEQVDALLTVLRERLAPFGLKNSVVLCNADGEPYRHPDVRPLDEALSADVLCNHRYDLPANIVAAFKRSMLVDIDPGQLQTAFDNGMYGFVPHTHYFTVGEWPKFLATTPVQFNPRGLTWHHLPPPVDIASWPVTPPANDAAFTTVTNWYSTDWMPDPDRPGEFYDNSKRTAFLPYIGLPRQTGAAMELAIPMGGSRSEHGLLEPLGWRVRDSSEVNDPQVYRKYQQDSLGEFSAAKASYVRLNTGWLSDRTVTYLASGKPAIVQKTGDSDLFPGIDGLLRFTDPASAAAAIRSVMNEYDHHCRAARQVAEAHLDARKVLDRALSIVLS